MGFLLIAAYRLTGPNEEQKPGRLLFLAGDIQDGTNFDGILRAYFWDPSAKRS